MDVFNTLNGDLQNLIIYQYTSLLKYIILFFVISLSIFYVHYYKKNIEKPTPYLSFGVLRTILTSLSNAIIWFSPLSLLMLHPAYTIDSFITMFYIMYGTIIIIFSIVLIGDFFQLAPAYLVKSAGYDIKNPRIRKGLQEFKRRYSR